jgi:hypothetical protein
VLWRRQYRNVMNALVVGIRGFIHAGIPVFGGDIGSIAHSRILS